MIGQLSAIIHHIQRDWQNKRLLVIGDVMLDKYIWGEVQRISPEAPVPVVLATHQSERAGGAANVAMNVARLGAGAIVVGFCGQDENAKALSNSLQTPGITPDLIACDDYPTVTKLRILGGHQQMLRLDSERNGERRQADYDALAERVAKHLPGCHAIILSDYLKGTLTPVFCQQLIRTAHAQKIPILVDTKNPDFTQYYGATTICPNLTELSAAARHFAPENVRFDLQDLLRFAKVMVGQLNLRFLTATLGEKGIALIRPDNWVVVPAVARQVFDVSGAGDTVAAVLALCLASGLTPEIGIELANLAAGIVVGKVGTVAVEQHELLAALTPEIAHHAESKIVPLNDLLARIAAWKASGDRVVFTNGCFDLLHIGHITLLERARSFGDHLIVAINSDASVRELKGANRPIVGQRERARILAALAAVDAVVIFDALTPLELIVSIRPDILVKGGDYHLEAVVGAKEVMGYGGQVRIVPTVEGFSTTALLERAQTSELSVVSHAEGMLTENGESDV